METMRLQHEVDRRRRCFAKFVMSSISGAFEVAFIKDRRTRRAVFQADRDYRRNKLRACRRETTVSWMRQPLLNSKRFLDFARNDKNDFRHAAILRLKTGAVNADGKLTAQAFLYLCDGEELRIARLHLCLTRCKNFPVPFRGLGIRVLK
jgi:hypothetical protein